MATLKHQFSIMDDERARFLAHVEENTVVTLIEGDEEIFSDEVENGAFPTKVDDNVILDIAEYGPSRVIDEYDGIYGGLDDRTDFMPAVEIRVAKPWGRYFDKTFDTVLAFARSDATSSAHFIEILETLQRCKLHAVPNVVMQTFKSMRGVEATCPGQRWAARRLDSPSSNSGDDDSDSDVM